MSLTIEVAPLAQQCSQAQHRKSDPQAIDDTKEDADNLVSEEGRERDDEEDDNRDNPTPRH